MPQDKNATSADAATAAEDAFTGQRPNLVVEGSSAANTQEPHAVMSTALGEHATLEARMGSDLENLWEGRSIARFSRGL